MSKWTFIIPVSIVALVAIVILGWLDVLNWMDDIAYSSHLKNKNELAQFVANLATIFGIVVGVIGTSSIIVAVYQYSSTARQGRNAHMHGLFTTYLKMRLEIKQLPPALANSYETRSDELAVRLYTLEEMYDWLLGERFPLVFGLHREYLDGWERTIVSHICGSNRHILTEHLRNNADCYGSRFLTLIATALEKDEEIYRIIELEYANQKKKELRADLRLRADLKKMKRRLEVGANQQLKRWRSRQDSNLRPSA